MIKFLKSKKAEGYIDVCVGVLVLMMVLVVTLNIYEFFIIRQDLDEISEQLIETATFNGTFNDEFNDRVGSLKEQFGEFNVSVSAEEYFNLAHKKVQLGDVMEITISKSTYIRGLGVIHIPITVSSHRYL